MTVPAPAAATPTPSAAPAIGADGQPITPQAAVTPPTPEPSATPPAPAPEVIGDPPAPVVPDAAAEGETFTYRETGDASLDVALGFVGNLGFGPEHPAIADAIEGKFEKLEAHLSALGDKAVGWERMVALAKDAYERSEAQSQAHQTAITSAVHEVAGSPEQWAAIKTWAGQNADPAEKAEINAMLTGGPVQARAAAMLLANLYGNAGGTTVTPADPTNRNAASGGSTANGALSPNDYANEVRALRAKLGGRDLDSSPEYAALQARRMAWRG